MLGVDLIDFVIFLLCWFVVEDMFCLLWFYCNVVSEFMGFVYGVYDVKVEGFVLGGVSLYNCMLGYGFDVDMFEKVFVSDMMKLYKVDVMMVFMFEICMLIWLMCYVFDIV